MFSRRVVTPIPALLAGWLFAGPAHAETGTSAVQTGPAAQAAIASLTANPDRVPEDVKVAASALRQARETWRRSVQPPPKVSGPAPVPSSEPRMLLPDHGLCEAVEDPNHFMTSSLWFAGWLGAVATVFGLALFCALRGVLLSLWNWRLPIGARPW